MCYNCGCQRPNDDMGNPKNITDKTFEEAAKAAGQSPEEAKKKRFRAAAENCGKEIARSTFFDSARSSLRPAQPAIALVGRGQVYALLLSKIYRIACSTLAPCRAGECCGAK